MRLPICGSVVYELEQSGIAMLEYIGRAQRSGPRLMGKADPLRPSGLENRYLRQTEHASGINGSFVDVDVRV